MEICSDPAMDAEAGRAGSGRSARCCGELSKFIPVFGKTLLLLAFTAAGTFASPQSEPGSGPQPAAAGQSASGARGPTLSILYFDTIAKATDFDWLRVGLSDMLTTDIVASGAVTVVER